MKKYIVEHEYDGYEIGTYLKETKGYSSRGLRNLEIYLNGKRIKNNAKKIKKLNRIVIIEKEKSTGIKAIDIPIDIAYEDENLLIVNKVKISCASSPIPKIKIFLSSILGNLDFINFKDIASNDKAL